MSTIKKNDFISLDYTGKLPEGMVFDTTNKDVAKSAGLPVERVHGPMIICVGERQLLAGLDAALEGKEVGKAYSVTLAPEQAFGKKDVKKLKIVPLNTFKEHKVQPHPGLQIDIDGQRGIVTRINGGRVMVNFNHPLAGKEITYDFTIKRVVSDVQEKVSAYLRGSLGLPEEQFSCEVKENKATIALPMELPEPVAQLFSQKLTSLTDLKEVVFTKKSNK